MARILSRWLEEEALTFSLRDPEVFVDAMDRMVEALPESTRLLALGQPLYHTNEFLVLRNQLFQRLVQAHDYTAIALDTGLARAREVDDFVKGCNKLSLDGALGRVAGPGFGYHAADRELLSWMREYNRDVAMGQKIGFHGFRPTVLESPKETLFFLLDYLESQGTPEPSRRARWQSLLCDDTVWEVADGSKTQALTLRLELEDLVADLERQRPKLWDRDRIAYLQALAHASVGRSLLAAHTTVSRAEKRTELLDATAAEVLKNVLERESGRVLAVGHNTLFRTTSTSPGEGWPPGAHLRSYLGEAFVAIGGALGSSFSLEIPRPEEETVESALMELRAPAFLLITSPIKALAKAGLPTRAALPEAHGYSPISAGCLEEFEALMFVPTVSHAVPNELFAPG